jgi:hypothetical protein
MDSARHTERRMQHERRHSDRRSSGLVLVHGDQPRHVYGAEAVESLRRACFTARGSGKRDVTQRVMCGRARPMSQLLTIADDVIPRLGGLLSASYLERTGLAFTGYVRAAIRESRSALEARALAEAWDDDNGGGAA